MTERIASTDAPPSPSPPPDTGPKEPVPDVSPELAEALPRENDGSDERPDPESIDLTPDRAAHILDGDAYGGGHRAGTGSPGRTEFPADWTDEQVLDHIKDVARNPDGDPVQQSNGRWRYEGVRDGVNITAIVEPDGRIWTAWPREGDPGVVRNPVL
jgi:EndoU nuclease-like protein